MNVYSGFFTAKKWKEVSSSSIFSVKLDYVKKNHFSVKLSIKTATSHTKYGMATFKKKLFVLKRPFQQCATTPPHLPISHFNAEPPTAPCTTQTYFFNDMRSPLN